MLDEKDVVPESMTAKRLPVIPVSEGVLFPNATGFLAVRKRIAINAVEVATERRLPLFIVSQRALDAVGEIEDPEDLLSTVLYSTGVVSARFESLGKLAGVLQVIVEAGPRMMATFRKRPEDGGYIEANVRPVLEIPPPAPSSPDFLALVKEVREHAMRLAEQTMDDADDAERAVAGIRDPGRLADFAATLLELPVEAQQELLEQRDVERRLRRVLWHTVRELHILDAQARIHEQVEEEVKKKQRKIFLREQLRVIRDQLGEDRDTGEVEELAGKLEALDLPPAAKIEVGRELAQLARLPHESFEAHTLRSHLDWVASLPWNIRSEDRLDLVEASQILDADHYGLTEVKDRILEVLAVHKLRSQRASAHGQHAASPILLFVGPPGVGKTSVAASVARAMGRECVRVSLGGVRDESDIRGHRRTYVGAIPGRIIHGMGQAGTKNPVFIIDEVDKLGVSVHGDPGSALLEVLDPEQNHSFTDAYLNMPFDLSEALFIATGNYEEAISPPLRDRMETIRFPGYVEREKIEIAKRHLVVRQAAQAALPALTFDDGALLTMIREHTFESGVRQLERCVGAVARKLARRVASGEPVAPDVATEVVRALLGRSHMHVVKMAAESEIGVATGLQYSSVGGDIMFVEASVRHTGDGSRINNAGRIEVILTGQLGAVMRESARAAISYVVSRVEVEGSPVLRRGPIEAHIHVPAGAVPKDGPSAGLAMATAMASVLTARPVRHDVAITGEITLRGRVLPVGGVREKVLGAARAGIRAVVLPKDNLPDLQDVPEELRGAMRFFGVSTVDEALACTLVPEPPNRPVVRLTRRTGLGDR